MTNSEINIFFEKIKADEALQNNIIEKACKAPEKWLPEFFRRGYFNPALNPKPIEDTDNKGFYQIPYWRILDLLKAACYKLNQLDQTEKYYIQTLKTIIEIVENLIYEELKRDTPEKQFNTNYHTNSVIIECISNLPISEVTTQHIKFCVHAIKPSSWGRQLTYALRKYLLPYLLKNEHREFILKLFTEALIKHDVSSSKEVIPYIDSYWLYDFFKHNKIQLNDLCGSELCDHIVKEIKSFPSKDVSINSIEDSNQNTATNEYETQLVFCLRNYLEYLPSSEAKPLIEEWLQLEKHVPTSVLFRLAIHGINSHYEDLKNIFWDLQFNPLQVLKFIDEDKRTFYYMYTKHEVWKLIEKHAKQIELDEIARKKLIHWLNDLQVNFKDETSDDERKKRIAYIKQEWLNPFKDLKGELAELYKEQRQINEVEVQHPGWVSYIWTVTEDEIKKEYFVDYKQFDLQETIEAFKRKFEYVNDFHKQDVSHYFVQHIAENTEKFIKELEALKAKDWNIQGSLIVGFNRAYINKKLTIKQQKQITTYILNLCNSQVFQGKDKEVIELRIVEFLQSGTSQEDNRFAKELWNDISSIFQQLNLLQHSYTEAKDDYLTDAINTPEGKFAEALIYFSEFNHDFKPTFRTIINDSALSTRLNAILGGQLEYLWSIDSEWFKSIIHKIFPLDNQPLFDATMQGYLCNLRSLYYPTGLFEYLKTNQILQYAIKNGIPKGWATNPEERLIDHIVIGYIQGIEKLEDSSLLNLVLSNPNEKQLSELIQYTWRRLDNDKLEKYTYDLLPDNKIQTLWKKLFEVLSKDTNKESYKKELIVELGLWISLLKDINEVKDLAIQSAKFMSHQTSQHFFIEYLAKHSLELNNAKACAEIFKTLLDNSRIPPDYEKANIEKLVENIFNNGEKIMANDICNKYLSKGILWLKPLYEKNNQ